MIIRDILSRDLSEKIREVIQVEQAEETQVYKELTEYVATDSIQMHYLNLFRAIADSKQEPTENNEVWISGFFGSGKSSFAKNLGYAIDNRQVLNQASTTLFINQMQSGRRYQEIKALLEVISTQIPMDVIMFDISANSNMRSSNEHVAEIMYRMLLEKLGFAKDYSIADLEIELEQEGKLQEFLKKYAAQYPQQSWEKKRAGVSGINCASAIMNEMDPITYPTADSWANVANSRRPLITVNYFASRVFELMALRRKGRGLAFIIDEVGQYVARSGEKLENLRTTIEALGREGYNRTLRREFPVPIWTFITSQERLNEVVDAIEQQRTQLPKVKDRFHYSVDLEASDIRIVATRRVLAKTPEGAKILQTMFEQNQGRLNAAVKLEESKRPTTLNAQNFIEFYPYLPHYIDLSIDIVSGMRLQPGADRHMGGSNRTIIKQAYEMLVSEKTNLQGKAIGQLVTLDLIYDLVEGNLSAERRRNIGEISQRFPQDLWTSRVAKVLCLLEYIHDLPRTPTNIAAMLLDTIEDTSPIHQTQAALNALESAQIVRKTAEGYKLLTEQEKTWDIERNGIPEPNDNIKAKMVETVIGKIFSEASYKTYRLNERTLQVNAKLNPSGAHTDGQIPLSLYLIFDNAQLDGEIEKYRALSRKERNNEIFWFFALNEDLHETLTMLLRSREMISRYERKSSMQELAPEREALLHIERKDCEGLEVRLKGLVEDVLGQGIGLFRGVTHDSSEQNKKSADVFRNLYSKTAAELYPLLDIGAKRMDAEDIDKILNAANYAGLPHIFYEGSAGLGLIKQDNGRYVVQRNAPIAEEIMRYIAEQQKYSKTVTGKELLERFNGIGYGWDNDIIRLTLAVLLRDSAITMTSSASVYKEATSPQAKQAIKNLNIFRSASFAISRTSIDIHTRVRATEHCEAIIGKKITADESTIAAEIRKFAREEITAVLSPKTIAEKYALPVTDILNRYYNQLCTLQDAGAEDCVNILADQGKDLKEMCDTARQITKELTESHLAVILQARDGIQQQWPLLQQYALEEANSQATLELESLLASPTFYEQFPRIETLTNLLLTAYRALYEIFHTARQQAYEQYIDRLRGHSEWPILQPAQEKSVLSPLQQGICAKAELTGSAAVCSRCHATIAQMKADIDASQARFNQSLNVLLKLTEPAEIPYQPDSAAQQNRLQTNLDAGSDERFDINLDAGIRETPAAALYAPRTQTVRIADYFDTIIDDAIALETGIGVLRRTLQELLDKGVRIRVE